MNEFIENLFDQVLKSSNSFDEIKNISDHELFEFYNKYSLKNQNLLVVLEELIMNSVEHAKCAPDFLYKKNNNEFIFIIKDAGVGIHETVPKNPNLSDTLGKTSTSIIRLSFEESITGTGQKGRGMGLYYLSRLVSETKGQCLVASDSGFVVKSSEVYTEKVLSTDIKQNIIILMINLNELGL